MKLLVMADHHVGLEITRWLLEFHREDLQLVVTTAENEIFSTAKDGGVATVIFSSTEQVCEQIGQRDLIPDIGLLAWWPKLIHPPLLTTPPYIFFSEETSCAWCFCLNSTCILAIWDTVCSLLDSGSELYIRGLTSTAEELAHPSVQQVEP